MENKSLVFVPRRIRLHLLLNSRLVTYHTRLMQTIHRTPLAHSDTRTQHRTEIVRLLLALTSFLSLFIFRADHVCQQNSQRICLSAFTIASRFIFTRTALILIRLPGIHCPETFFTGRLKVTFFLFGWLQLHLYRFIILIYVSNLIFTFHQTLLASNPLELD